MSALLKPRARAWAAVKYPPCSEASSNSPAWLGLPPLFESLSCIGQIILDLSMTSKPLSDSKRNSGGAHLAGCVALASAGHRPLGARFRYAEPADLAADKLITDLRYR